MGVLAEEFKKFCSGRVDDTGNPVSPFEGFPEEGDPNTDAHEKWTEALKLGIADWFSITNNIGIGTAGDIAGDIEKGLATGLLVADFASTAGPGGLRDAVVTAMGEVAKEIANGTKAGSSLLPLFPSWVSTSPDAPDTLEITADDLKVGCPWYIDAPEREDQPEPDPDETRTVGEIFADGLEATILEFFTPGKSVGSLVVLAAPIPLDWIIPAGGGGDIADPPTDLENQLPELSPSQNIVLDPDGEMGGAKPADIEAIFIIATTLLGGFRKLHGETEDVHGLKPDSQPAMTYMQALRDGFHWDSENEVAVQEGGFLKKYGATQPNIPGNGSASRPYALSDAVVALL